MKKKELKHLCSRSCNNCKHKTKPKQNSYIMCGFCKNLSEYEWDELN